MRNNLIALALVAAVLPVSPAMARQSNGYVVRTTTMRAGPAYDYPAVQRLNRNSSVTVYGCLRDWSWCDVGNRYDRGWVARRDISVEYLGRRRSIGSSMGIVILSFSFGNYWDNHYRSRPFYSQRTRWQQQYNKTYRPEWGPRERPRIVVPQPRQPQTTSTPQYSPPRQQPAPQVTVPPRAPRATPPPGRSGTSRTRPAPVPQVKPNPGKPQGDPGNGGKEKSGKGRKPSG